MITITLDTNQESHLERFIRLAEQLKIAITVNKQSEETTDTLWIQSQLYEKYVKTGKWQNMDDEDRQDAVVLEKMLLTETRADFETVSIDEAEDFLNKLRQGVL